MWLLCFTGVLVSMDPPAQALSMTLASPTGFPHPLPISLLCITTLNGQLARPRDAVILTTLAKKYSL